MNRFFLIISFLEDLFVFIKVCDYFFLLGLKLLEVYFLNKGCVLLCIFEGEMSL